MNCSMFEGGFDIERPANADKQISQGGLFTPRVIPKNPPEGCNLTIDILLTTRFTIKTGPWYYGNMQGLYHRPNPSCPYWLMWTGIWSEDPKEVSVSAAHCTPYLEKLEVDTTFTDSNFTIDTSHPPKPVPGTSKVINRNVTMSSTHFNYLFDDGTYTSGKPDSYEWNMNSVFNIMLDSGMISSPADLIGPENANQLIEKTRYLFSLGTAQLINSAVNENITMSVSLQEQHQAGVMRQSTLRLVQSPISTHILAGLLGVMLVCGVAAYATLRTRNVVPNDPGSIAAKASLLAGSRLISEDVIPPGAEWLSDKQLRERGCLRRIGSG